ncbi:MAG TPA: hypothetical protein VGY66_24410, partial [Gemmataceae bacterium]|nr:hypothetical protein [Gemmataceae bacterium]
MLFASWLRRLTMGSATRSRRRGSSPPLSRRSVLPRLDVLEDRSLPSTFTVTNLLDGPSPGPSGSLRAGILSGDATIAFAPALHGTIALSSELPINHSVTINGPGANHLSVSGDNTYRVFDISNNATVTIDSLTIKDGQTVGGDGQPHGGYGGGILNEAGATLNLDHIVMTDNQAMAGTGGIVGGSGGAIENLGSLAVSVSTFTNNEASLNSMFIMNSDKFGSNGGAIDSSGPSLTVNSSTFSTNTAAGTSTQNGSGNGGAIFSLSSTATVTNSTFNGNAALGRDDAAGAIDEAGGLMTISNSTFTSNRVVGGNGANDITYGSGGEALGGAITNAAPLTISNSTFTDNVAKAGDGGDASSDGIDFIAGRSQVGTATGGGVVNFFSSLTVTNSTFTDNQAIGGNSAMGPGGDAAGGGVVAAGTNLGGGTTTLTNVTFAGNQAIGGSGGSSGIFNSIPYTGAGGRGFGGGFYNGIYS